MDSCLQTRGKMVEQDKNQISEQEAELYDRQIRWEKI
jgi:hypothetical protein